MANNCKLFKGRRALQYCLVLLGLCVLGVYRYGVQSDYEEVSESDDGVASFVRANKEVATVQEIDSVTKAIGPHRIVHLDLKGAVPTVAYLSQLFPFVKTLGATGLLIEYEDTFPYTSADVSSGDAYSKGDIEEILRLANESQLIVIPLVQTFGHLEFVLKLESYKHLRESQRYPQAICPSKNESLRLLHNLIDEVLAAHKHSEYIHIGCDEVYQLGLCEDCRAKMFAEDKNSQELFLNHVTQMARYIKRKYPSVKVLIWDDELRHVPLEMLTAWKLSELLEPVVWKYTEDVDVALDDELWRKYHKTFPNLWFATAFKGAKEPNSVTNVISVYLDNHRSWVRLIKRLSATLQFRGVMLTGWQRYDHFSVLCELLPTSIPSLAVNLIYLRSEYRSDLVKITMETQTVCRCDSNPVLAVNNYPVHCDFPGSRLFHTVIYIGHVFEQVEAIKQTNTFRGWFSAYNRNHSFSAPSHVEKATNELVNLYADIVSLERDLEDAMDSIYKPGTFTEWSSTYIQPLKNELQTIVQARDRLLAVDSWPKRPIP